MPHKLDRRILDLVETTPIPAPTRVDRRGLKKTADAVCEALSLGKCDHSTVIGAMIAFIEAGKLTIVGGHLAQMTAEMRVAQGRRDAGRHKRHARGRTQRTEWVPIDPLVPALS